MKRLAIDLFCGLGGWAEGFLAEGYYVVGFDIEQHDYGTGGYPGQLVIQDVLTLHGNQFRDAAVIVASPPCQAYSYRAMPWKRAKALPPPDNSLFEACFRIQREAIEAAGRFIPLIVENVRGAQKWVGRAKANFGSYYLWGDVGMVGRRVIAGTPCYGVSIQPMRNGGQKSPPGNASSPMWKDREISRTGAHATPEEAEKLAAWVKERDGATKVPSFRFDGSGKNFQTASVRRTNPGNGARFTSRDCGIEAGVKQSGISGPRTNGKGDKWFQDGAARHGSKSDSRKAASAQIAKIPFPLSQHIARVFG